MAMPSGAPNWRTYDGVADIYGRVDAAVFLAPARDLVAMITPARGGRVLDIGTGTGCGAAAAAEMVGARGMVTGIDLSMDMLRVARGRGVLSLVRGDAMRLPFGDNAFQAVMASFVLSHFRSVAALAEIVRVIASGGRFGATAWGPTKTEAGELWRDVAQHFLAGELLDRATAECVPSEEFLSDPGNLCRALEGSGLRDVRVHRRQYPVTLSHDDYLSGRETSAAARFLRQALDEASWARVRERLATSFRARYPDPLRYTNDVLIGTGMRR